jgi:hypothetical protein
MSKQKAKTRAIVDVAPCGCRGADETTTQHQEALVYNWAQDENLQDSKKREQEENNKKNRRENQHIGTLSFSFRLYWFLLLPTTHAPHPDALPNDFWL